MNKIWIINANIVLENQILNNGFLEMSGGKITVIDQMDNCPSLASIENVIDCQLKGYIIPGMIDIHVHGALGHDFMDADQICYSKMAKYLASEGITAFLATTMTAPMSEIEATIEELSSYYKNQPTAVAEMLGIHLEGPFINGAKKGAQPEEYILKPNVQQFNDLYDKSQQSIRLVTFAPEEDSNFELLKELTSKGIIASIGHSDADYHTAIHALKAGITHATHLFNGMSGLHHRDPGVVGAVLLAEDVYVEVIPDNIHFHKDLLPMVYKMTGLDRLLVITDGIRAKGMPDGMYSLGGNEVEVINNQCIQRKTGSLAGSVLNMNTARKNIEEWLTLSIVEQMRLVSLNQAVHLGFDKRKGSIALGKDADVVWLNEEGEVEKTFCLGNLAFEKG
ncbi:MULTISPECIES: N-acetylglucosamine-6-phosphate deacetylase [Lysinibacillus]|jgi:N-acetylglucosamine-6-phosphate deacetylase|uniref:N-acetylglucosamine-6-phosphate deacetylase n=1 Tax=Lysinibacillus TaxID=400634 RepID=UPI000885A6EF|nr:MULTISPECIES: N-acetylglucosamine-6-phosphate deacetylase [unclassified Lysinibacillus]MEE3807435.1 N-acetylglucosamine-6-phosphate deacetylase [Lysinibacillus fusiformis]WCH48506.1 N-acetylglucosamine-6-phosphate deacetylase [Lysinibacillus sp. OF-1]SCX75789.1 N-acetylglucosamine 6-phosphate deacetylase [Lysinibacillus sp. SG9]SDB01894.1 N-acetylglucosamine 6-phosphate deacetylase [Lysinibacillus sp. TC-37]SFS29980.1 N-acetylglucosamine 6-phosphate deacetylase [Lysinibacillus sp. SG55]